MDELTRTELTREDVIDESLVGLLNEMLPQTDDSSFDQDLEEVSSLLFQVIGDLVDEQKIKDLPDFDADDHEKLNWVNESLSLIRKSLEEQIHGNTDLK